MSIMAELIGGSEDGTDMGVSPCHYTGDPPKYIYTVYNRDSKRIKEECLKYCANEEPMPEPIMRLNVYRHVGWKVTIEGHHIALYELSAGPQVEDR